MKQEEDHHPIVEAIERKAAELFPEVVALRRDLHAHPELSLQEHRTTALITSYLMELGITPEKPLLDTGVIALIRGKSPHQHGKVVALRADIDALPLQEENAEEYCSVEAGKMHACGHDMHTAMLLGAAKILSGMREQLAGDVLLIFQPSEEKAPGGARPFLDAGLFTTYKPSLILGQHCFPTVASGNVAFCRGAFMAAADELYITVNGKGGHASAPHKAADPVLAAAHMVTAVQQLVSRVVPPHETAVVTISAINGGHATNVIPRQVTMMGTMRSMNEEIRMMLQERLKQTIYHTAQAFGVEAELTIVKGYPVLYNDPSITDQASCISAEYLGHQHVQHCQPLMTAEDFAYYLQECPGTFWQIGTGMREGEVANMLHSPTFNPDEQALQVGTGLLAYSAYRFLASIS